MPCGEPDAWDGLPLLSDCAVIALDRSRALRSRATGVQCSGSDTSKLCQGSSGCFATKLERSAVVLYAYAKSAMVAMPDAVNCSWRASGTCSSCRRARKGSCGSWREDIAAKGFDHRYGLGPVCARTGLVRQEQRTCAMLLRLLRVAAIPRFKISAMQILGASIPCARVERAASAVPWLRVPTVLRTLA